MAKSTKEVIDLYFDGIRQKKGWEDYISEEISFTSPRQSTIGKHEYLTATKRFLQLVQSSEVQQLIIEEDKVCAYVNYEVKSPAGLSYNCKVAEILRVSDGKISSSTILFDTVAFKNFIEQAIAS